MRIVGRARIRRRARRGAWLIGVLVGALAPARASAKALFPRLGGTRAFATSLRIDPGITWSRHPAYPRGSSIHVELGPKFFSGNFSGDDPRYGLYLQPSVGVRVERAAIRRRYAEIGFEAGIGPSFEKRFRSGDTWTPFTMGYRAAGLLGTVDRPGRTPVFSSGLRHGPVLGVFAGILTVGVSHEVITQPETAQGLRLGVGIELNPIIWMMTGIW